MVRSRDYQVHNRKPRQMIDESIGSFGDESSILTVRPVKSVGDEGTGQVVWYWLSGVLFYLICKHYYLRIYISLVTTKPAFLRCIIKLDGPLCRLVSRRSLVMVPTPCRYL